MASETEEVRSCLNCSCAKKIATWIICATGILYYSVSQLRQGMIGLGQHNHLGLSSNSNNYSESFSSAMASIPWDEIKIAISSKDWSENAAKYYEQISAKLSHFAMRPPPVAINKSCVPPPLKIVSSGFTCIRLQKPRRVGVLLLFGFDVDALEIHFHELNDVVDKFFIVESTVPHNHFLEDAKKPLLWKRLRYDPRFAKFKSKVVHFVMDDTKPSTPDEDRMWRVESQQVEFRWTKFMEWNSKTGFFKEKDLLGFGHTDEIPHRDNIFTLKHCQLPVEGKVDIGIWFPSPYINTAYRSDFPVENHPYTLGNPTYWRQGEAMKYFTKLKKFPNGNWGHSRAFLLGGMHMSSYVFPPFAMLKRMSCSECSWRNFQEMIRVGMLYGKKEKKKADGLLLNYFISGPLSTRTERISKLIQRNKKEVDAVVKLPWFVKCNLGRYPSLREIGSDLRVLE